MWTLHKPLHIQSKIVNLRSRTPKNADKQIMVVIDGHVHPEPEGKWSTEEQIHDWEIPPGHGTLAQH